MTRPLLVLLLLTGACTDTVYSGPRYASSEDGVSFARLDGWYISRERATLVLRSRGRSATIAIRTIPRDGSSDRRTAENVIPAVGAALRALPRAKVTGPAALDTADYPAVAFDVDFVPRGRRYQRRHVTLVAETYIIHVFLVAPAGQLSAARRDLDTIVKTIHEEG